MQVFSHSFRQAKNKDYARPSEIYDLFLVDQDTPDAETLHFANWYETISFFDYPDGNAAQYLPLGISRGKIEATSNLEIDSLQLQLDNVDKALASLAASYDLRDKRVVARLVFRNLLSSPNDAKVLFDGTISDVMFPQGKLVVKVVSKLGDLITFFLIITDFIASIIFSFFQGFTRKSEAPSLSDLIARSISP